MGLPRSYRLQLHQAAEQGRRAPFSHAPPPSLPPTPRTLPHPHNPNPATAAAAGPVAGVVTGALGVLGGAAVGAALATERESEAGDVITPGYPDPDPETANQPIIEVNPQQRQQQLRQGTGKGGKEER